MAVPKDLLERIQLRLDESFTGIGAAVADLAAADVAELLNQLRIVEAATVITMLSIPRAVEVMDQPTLTRRSAIVERLEPGRAAQVLEGLSADQRTEIFRHMGEHERRRLLPKLKPEVRAEVEQLLQYPEHTAGGIMTTEFVRLQPSMTVGEAIKHIRAIAQEKESIYACYVLEPGSGRLLGSVSLRDLVMADLAQPVTVVMRKKPVAVSARDDQELVAKKIAKYNLLAVPVLESDGRVVGFVTVDDVIDVLIEEQTEDMLKMAGVEAGALDKPYFENPIFLVVRKRIGWLLLLFVAETLTGTVLSHYGDDLSKVVALSFFIPLLIGTGGNAGAQTVTTIIRSLALNEVGVPDVWRVLARELSTGALVGTVIAAVAFGYALLWGQHMPLAVTVAVTVLAICTWSTTVGALIPLAAERLGLDPTVLSSPLITTLVDATGLVIYFSIAKAILNL
jgi:magnesium transporter